MTVCGAPYCSTYPERPCPLSLSLSQNMPPASRPVDRAPEDWVCTERRTLDPKEAFSALLSFPNQAQRPLSAKFLSQPSWCVQLPESPQCHKGMAYSLTHLALRKMPAGGPGQPQKSYPFVKPVRDHVTLRIQPKRGHSILWSVNDSLASC